MNIMPSLALNDCRICPRDCGVNRLAGETGYCRTGPGYYISSIFLHRGEEPPISGEKGICNIFFAHCNLQCVYCQNYQISRNDTDNPTWRMEFTEVLRQVESLLDRGSAGVGFVSPSHCIPQMRAIIRALRVRGRSPVTVMNTGGYDRSETIRSLRGEIDVYLPDLKYLDAELAAAYSGAADYPEVARAALKEIFRQKGEDLQLTAEETVKSGLIIRHLVLPGEVENSKACLRFIAEELSPAVHISLMAQYHPTPPVRNHRQLGRLLRAEEYEEVKAELPRLGFSRGWVQEVDSPGHYLPDFDRRAPF